MSEPQSARILRRVPAPLGGAPSPAPSVEYGQATDPHLHAVLDLTDFKRDLSELTDRLGNAQDCL